MLKKEIDQENLEKILVSNAREKNYFTDLDEKNFKKAILPFTTNQQQELTIPHDDPLFRDNGVEPRTYALFRIKRTDTAYLAQLLSQLDFSRKAYVVFVVAKVSQQWELENRTKINEIRKALKDMHPSLNRTNINGSIIDCVFFNPRSQGNYPITITRRSDSIRNSDVDSLDGYIFTARLKDIVEIYNAVGDSLFDCNVRYKIQDSLHVDSEITNTLNLHPEMFWFYNNGITMVINDKDFQISAPDHIVLTNKGKKTVSVINGAQTITAAAKFYSESAPEQSGSENAMVILRLINIADDANFKRNVNHISIALNRQKSINDQDISFTFEFVDQLNRISYEFESDDPIAFELYKRGGSSYCKYSYDLIDFAKLAKCYLAQKPGVARNYSLGLLSSTYNPETESYEFKDNEIFMNIANKDDFRRYYSPTNFAWELISAFQSIAKEHLYQDDLCGDIYHYGGWYFVAKTIRFLNKDHSDFSSFDFDYSKLSADQKRVMTDLFVSEFETLTDIDRYDSNDFKNENLYQTIKEPGQMPEFESYLTGLFF